MRNSPKNKYWLLVGFFGVGYLLSRFWRLTEWPVYFFTDEANIALIGEGLWRGGLKGPDGSFLPVYFQAAPERWTPVLTAYFQGLAAVVLGKSVLVVRGVTVIFSLLGVIALALAAKLVCRHKSWWLAGVVLAVMPPFFLHSRTGFETAIATSGYALFVLFYLLYLKRSPYYLVLAIVFGYVSFYSYSNMQAVVAVTGVGFLLVDIKRHLRNWRVVTVGALLVLLLSLPFYRFQVVQKGAFAEHLCTLNSYLCQEISLPEKALVFGRNYRYALSPDYWLAAGGPDIPRHLMAGYTFLPGFFAPFLLLGLLFSLLRFRLPEYRVGLIALAAAPVGASLAQVTITRVLVAVIPFSLLITIGLEESLNWLGKFIPRRLVEGLVFSFLTAFGGLMTYRAVTYGPFWYPQYGLYWLQYGAERVFGEEIPRYLRTDPRLRVTISSDWANAPEVFVPFFLAREDQNRVVFRNLDYYQRRKVDLTDTLVILTPSEYERLRADPKFKVKNLEQVVNYPNNQPGFYFLTLDYSPEAEELMRQEAGQRRQLVESQVAGEGEPVRVYHSQLGAGLIENVFDGNPATLIRGVEANPLVIDLIFPRPRVVSGVELDLGSMDLGFEGVFYRQGHDQPVVVTKLFRGLSPDPHVDIPFEQSLSGVLRARLLITNLQLGERAEIHIRELTIR